MANYYSKFRTNYFSVTSMEELKKLVEFYNECRYGFIEYDEDKDKVALYGDDFSDFFSDEDEEEFYFLDLLQKLVPEDEVVWQEIGYEKFRYPVGQCIVITRSDQVFVDKQSEALKTAKELLKNSNYETKMSYWKSLIGFD